MKQEIESIQYLLKQAEINYVDRYTAFKCNEMSKTAVFEIQKIEKKCSDESIKSICQNTISELIKNEHNLMKYEQTVHSDMEGDAHLAIEINHLLFNSLESFLHQVLNLY